MTFMPLMPPVPSLPSKARLMLGTKKSSEMVRMSELKVSNCRKSTTAQTA